MNQPVGRRFSRLAFLALGIALGVAPSRTAAQADSPDAKACALLPKEDLQAVLGEKADAAPWRAQESEYGSLCSLRFGESNATIQSVSAKAPGAAQTVAQRLAGMKAMLESDKQTVEAKDFGDAGCLRISPSNATPSWRLTCFVAKGGRLTLELYSPKSLEFDAGRALVVKAAAKRSS